MVTARSPWYQHKFDNLLHAYLVIAKEERIPDIPQTSMAADFIAACLVRDPAKRPTAEELLGHSFVS